MVMHGLQEHIASTPVTAAASARCDAAMGRCGGPTSRITHPHLTPELRGWKISLLTRSVVVPGQTACCPGLARLPTDSAHRLVTQPTPSCLITRGPPPPGAGDAVLCCAEEGGEGLSAPLPSPTRRPSAPWSS